MVEKVGEVSEVLENTKHKLTIMHVVLLSLIIINNIFNEI
jgi:hypothetical protein